VQELRFCSSLCRCAAELAVLNLHSWPPPLPEEKRGHRHSCFCGAPRLLRRLLPGQDVIVLSTAIHPSDENQMQNARLPRAQGPALAAPRSASALKSEWLAGKLFQVVDVAGAVKHKQEFLRPCGGHSNQETAREHVLICLAAGRWWRTPHRSAAGASHKGSAPSYMARAGAACEHCMGVRGGGDQESSTAPAEPKTA
jgi:hypothetical protein